MKKTIEKFYPMKNFVGLLIFIFTLSTIAFNANAKEPEVRALKFKTVTQKPDSIKKENPKIRIKVNRKYDDKGNIIGYDSTYSYSYTYPNGEKRDISIDSLMNKFKPFFFENSPNFFNNSFDEFFNNDSTFQSNFFDNDFFQKNFKEEKFNFDKMMRQMDSVKNKYLKQNYPNMKIKKNKKKVKSTNL